MNKLKLLSLAAAITATGILVACDATTTTSATEETSEETAIQEVEEEKVTARNTVVDIAIGSADHSTLVTALSAADLVTTLEGNGPFTIFAPTDAAFEKLPAGTVDNLVKPENKEKLSGVLTYHVVSGNILVSDLSDGQVINTLSGEELKVSKKDGNVMINGANITTADLDGSNGVVHVIDAVLIKK